MKQPDPWSEIAAAGSGQDLLARRVDPDHPHNFFWARDADGRASLVVRYAPENACPGELPALQGIELTERPRLPGEQAALIVTLKRPEDQEIFFRFCCDLIEAARACPSEQEAVQAAVSRTWKWHSLLKLETDRRLSVEEQQGLVGELLFLEHLLGRVDAPTALSFWRGPLGEPKDFLANGRAAEIKARQGGRPFVKISSEYQLDSTGLLQLFLVVIELSPAGQQTQDAFTLDGLVERVRSSIEKNSPSSLPQFSGLLMAGGYHDQHDYSDRWWLAIGMDVFDVRSSFPAVTPSMLPTGTSECRYHLELLACTPFSIDRERLFSAFSGETTC